MYVCGYIHIMKTETALTHMQVQGPNGHSWVQIWIQVLVNALVHVTELMGWYLVSATLVPLP